MGCARSHNLVGHGQRLADVVQHEVRVDALRRGVVDELRGPHEFFRKQRIKDKYGEISNWDTSRVTDMFCMFQFAHSFNQPLNNWNVSNVTNMREMFSFTSSGEEQRSDDGPKEKIETDETNIRASGP